jgi:hypothetical protein
MPSFTKQLLSAELARGLGADQFLLPKGCQIEVGIRRQLEELADTVETQVLALEQQPLQFAPFSFRQGPLWKPRCCIRRCARS